MVEYLHERRYIPGTNIATRQLLNVWQMEEPVAKALRPFTTVEEVPHSVFLQNLLLDARRLKGLADDNFTENEFRIRANNPVYEPINVNP